MVRRRTKQNLHGEIFGKEEPLRFLVIGCGGTGSEMVKILSQFYDDITVIDFDRIAISNLCRQFYYREEDEGKYKTEIIGEKLEIKHINGKIQDNMAIFDKCDVIFSCVDNIEARMDINMMFIQTGALLLIDLGVEDFMCHVKKVHNDTSCLCCIKDLFAENEMMALCSITSTESITPENRTKALRTLALEYKDRMTNEEIVDLFNSKVAPGTPKTDSFEMMGYTNEIIPNTACINSICASLAILLFNDSENDFYFYNGKEGLNLTKHSLEKDEECLVCSLRQ